MKSIYEYTDYRAYLKDAYQTLREKDKAFTYAVLCKKWGIRSAGYISQVFHGSSNLQKKMVPVVGQSFQLSGPELRYFEALVAYNQAKNHETKNLYFKKLLRFKQSQLGNISPEQYELFEKWHYTAILSLIGYQKFTGDYTALSKSLCPPISVIEAKKAVETLLKLKLLVRNGDGSLEISTKHISTGKTPDDITINNFVINTLDIAKDAFYRTSKKQRNFSALTVGISADGYEKIVQASEEFRNTIIDIVKSDTAIDRVYQLNTQLFPLTVLPQQATEDTSDEATDI